MPDEMSRITRREREAETHLDNNLVSTSCNHEVRSLQALQLLEFRTASASVVVAEPREGLVEAADTATDLQVRGCARERRTLT